MKWRNSYDTQKLSAGHLSIIGGTSRSASRVQKLTNQNAIDLVRQVAVGVNGRRITKISFAQIELPRNRNHFSAFIQGLLAIPHLTDIDLCSTSTFSPSLTLDQLSTLRAELVGTDHLRRLRIQGQDTREGSVVVSRMLAGNQNAMIFECNNLSDDIFGFSVLAAGIGNARLRGLCLDMAARPFCVDERFVRPVGTAHFPVLFEGGYRIVFPAQVVQAEAAAVQEVGPDSGSESEEKPAPAEAKAGEPASVGTRRALGVSQVPATLYSRSSRSSSSQASSALDQPAGQGPSKRARHS